MYHVCYMFSADRTDISEGWKARSMLYLGGAVILDRLIG